MKLATVSCLLSETRGEKKITRSGIHTWDIIARANSTPVLPPSRGMDGTIGGAKIEYH
jgi:hypothetical protein